jgi:hypothetical protein
MLDVRCTALDVRCTMLDVRYTSRNELTANLLTEI